MRKHSFYLGLVACLLIGGAAQADPVYTYTLQLPTIAGNTEVGAPYTDYEFSWEGPLTYGAAPGSSCPTVCGPVVPGSTVEAGYTFDGFTFTSSGTDPEVQVNFDAPEEFSVECAIFSCGTSTIVFSFIEPDSFWATTTGSSYVLFPDSGASYVVTGGIDPGCATCAVNISASTTATPEPRSSILLVALMAAFGLVLRHRKQSKTIS